MTESDEDPLIKLERMLREQREQYETEVLKSEPFQDGLRYLEGITSDFLLALTYVRFQGLRFVAEDHYLVFRFAPHFVESALSVLLSAKEGLQNAARRELRFMLEAAIKLSSQDVHQNAGDFQTRLAGLDDRQRRFEDYVAELSYFDEFRASGEANAEITSLYKELSRYVHASVPQLREAMTRSKRGEPTGMETVATLNRFNKLAFRIYDIALVRVFHGIGLSMAGDVFTTALDDMPRWRFHKGKFVERMSRCFDYKHERRVRHGEI